MSVRNADGRPVNEVQLSKKVQKELRKTFDSWYQHNMPLLIRDSNKDETDLMFEAAKAFYTLGRGMSAMSINKTKPPVEFEEEVKVLQALQS